MKRYVDALLIGASIGLLAAYGTSMPIVLAACLAIAGTAAAFHAGGERTMSRFTATIREKTDAMRQAAEVYRASTECVPRREIAVIITETAKTIDAMAEELDNRDREVVTLKQMLREAYGYDRK